MRTQIIHIFGALTLLASMVNAQYDQTWTVVWRQGASASKLQLALSNGQLNGSHVKGYRVQWIDTSGNYKIGTRTSFVKRESAGGELTHTGMTLKAFGDRYLSLFAQGWRVHCMDFSEVDGGRVTACWRPGTYAQGVEWGLTREQFIDRNLKYLNGGLRLKVLRKHLVSGVGLRYAGIWVSGSGGQQIILDESWAQVIECSKRFEKMGLRLASLDEYSGDFCAVWREGKGAWGIDRGLSTGAFESKRQELAKDGIHPFIAFARHYKQTPPSGGGSSGGSGGSAPKTTAVILQAIGATTQITEITRAEFTVSGPLGTQVGVGSAKNKKNREARLSFSGNKNGDWTAKIRVDFKYFDSSGEHTGTLTQTFKRNWPATTEMTWPFYVEYKVGNGGIGPVQVRSPGSVIDGSAGVRAARDVSTGSAPRLRLREPVMAPARKTPVIR